VGLQHCQTGFNITRTLDRADFGKIIGSRSELGLGQNFAQGKKFASLDISHSTQLRLFSRRNSQIKKIKIKNCLLVVVMIIPVVLHLIALPVIVIHLVLENFEFIYVQITRTFDAKFQNRPDLLYTG